MKVRHLLMGASLLATMTLSAQAHQGNFSGFYSGVQLGYGDMKSDANSLINRDDAHRRDRSTQKGTISGSNVIGGLHMGYGHQFSNSVYLGIEGYGNFAHHSAKMAIRDKSSARGGLGGFPDREYERTLKLNRKHIMGIAFHPGFVFGNTLLYAKFGIESSSFNFSVSETNRQGGAIVNPDYNQQKGFHKRIIGFVPGIGVSFRVSDHLLLGFEANHGIYKKSTLNISKKGSQASFKSQTNEFFARVSYKW